MLLIVEFGLVLTAFALALLQPTLGNALFCRVERGIERLANKRFLAVVTVGGSALLLRVLLLPWLPIPVPAVHDEFSYLLMADTFAHGRLTNPTHPMWMHFETFHEIQKPTYASMYYPAQGLFLAFGQVVFGHPFWGVWLSAGLMCAAICWALQGWVSPFWAFIGGFLAVLRIGTVSYWANSYWGGAVAALGGALVLGALPRIQRSRRVRVALLMGVGFALLANTRPYESIFFSIPIFASIVIWARSPQGPSPGMLARRVVVPLGTVGAVALGAMGYYFWGVTGSPFHPPFFVNLATYNPVPYFPWQSIRSIPVYHHPVMEKFYLGWWESLYSVGRDHPLLSLQLKFWIFGLFFLGPLFGAVLLAATFTIPYGASFRHFSRRTRFMVVLCAVVLVGAALPVYFNPHYVAAITAALYVLILGALRRLRRWKPFGRPAGLAFVRWTFVIAGLMLPLLVATPQRHIGNLLTWCSPAVYGTWRAEIQKQLLTTGGSHLVIVRYSADHAPIDEWVFNHADIDGSKIVWARDMGAEMNQELISYFRGRKIWVVDSDAAVPTLLPYANEAQ